MSFTKRQKTLSAVFAVGLVVLVADRTVLRPHGGPGAASAEDPPSRPVVSLSDSAPGVEEPPVPTGLAQRLNNLSPAGQPDPNAIRDPFSLAHSWLNPGDASGERTPDVYQEFARKHQLQAVGGQGPKSYALVDGNALVPGQFLDGFKLIVVGDRSAVFERDGQRTVLELVTR